MLAAVEWDAVTMAGAFIVGILAGALLTVRLTRVIADQWRRRVDRRDDD